MEQRFHTPWPSALEVKVPVGDVVVETVDGEETLITADGDERLLDNLVIEQRGDRVVVELRGKRPRGITVEIGSWVFGGNELRIRARVPHGTAAVLSGASADMKLTGRYGSLESKTASGDLVLRGEVERDAAIKTVSGDAKLDQVHGTLTVQTVSGDVYVDHAHASVTAKSVSGDVRIRAAYSGEATFQSVSGDVEVGVAQGTNLDVDANSVSGDLSSDVPLGAERDGVHSDGPTLVVRGKTVSGDFKVIRA
jgi:hypothetical protein